MRIFRLPYYSFNIKACPNIYIRNWSVQIFSQDYSNPSTYVASINVVSIYVVKFCIPSNFNLRRHSIYVTHFGANCNVNRGITVSSYNFFKFLVKSILLLCSMRSMKFDLLRFDLRRLFSETTAT